MAGPVVAGVAHAGDVAHPAKARCVGRNDDQAGAAVGIGVGVGDGHHDRKARSVGRRGKPFAAVDHIMIAIAHGHCPHPDRVGAGVVGLGHGKTTANIAAHQGGQPAILLGLGAEFAEDFHVASVGRLAVDDVMAERTLAELFADQSVLHAVEPQPAVRSRNMRGPEAQRLHLPSDRIQFRHQLGKRLRQKRGLEGNDLACQSDRGSQPRISCMRSGIEKSIRGLAPGW